MNCIALSTLLFAAMTPSLFAQQPASPCPPATKTQKAANFLNRLRGGSNASPDAGCDPSASAQSTQGPPTRTANGGLADGTVIGTGTSSVAPLSGMNGIIPKDGGGTLIRWQRRSIDFPVQVYFTPGIAAEGSQAQQVEIQMAQLQGKGPDGAIYLTGAGKNLKLTYSGRKATLSVVSKIPSGLTNLDGSPIDVGTEPLVSSYTFQPYSAAIEKALHAADLKQPGAGLNANQHGGTITAKTGDEPAVEIAVIQGPQDPRHLWIEQNDASKGFLLNADNTTAVAVIKQSNGTWMTEDGREMTVAGGIAVLK